MAMAAARDDLAATVGGRIQRILQPSAASIGLSVYASGSRSWLLMSADARNARAHRTAAPLAKGFATPSPFVMLLRKYLDGGHITGVVQLPYERILHLECEHAGQPSRLTIEVMGKHSNVILVDGAGIILGALKVVSLRQSRVRPVIPRLAYKAPPARPRNESLYGVGPRIDPCQEEARFRSTFMLAPPDTPTREALAGLLPGCGPFLADQIARQGTADPEEVLGAASLDELVAAAQQLYRLLTTRAWEPCTFLGPSLSCDFAPYRPVGVDAIAPAPSISLAIDRCVDGVESHDALATVRDGIEHSIQRALRRNESKIASLRVGLQATEQAEKVMQSGQLILAYGHAFVPNSDHLEIPDLGLELTIDPRLSPQDNAEKLFRRYRKLREAARRIPSLLRAAENESSRLRELLIFARIAGDEKTLRELERQIVPTPASATLPARARPQKRGPLRFRRDGYTAIVGRNAQENEEVTFRLAGRSDLWLHARGRTGAHVVLQGQADPPDSIVSAAAALAAYFSEARSDTRVDVAVARVRDVQRVTGALPGRVTFRGDRTIRVEPSLEAWQRL
jgi:predicted ribosome quality control (RQC) complex YloA/Tae2 family protein